MVSHSWSKLSGRDNFIRLIAQRIYSAASCLLELSPRLWSFWLPLLRLGSQTSRTKMSECDTSLDFRLTSIPLLPRQREISLETLLRGSNQQPPVRLLTDFVKTGLTNARARDV